MNNLAVDPKYAPLLQSLNDKLAELMKSKQDSWAFNSQELCEEGGRLYKHKTFYTLDEYKEWTKGNPD